MKKLITIVAILTLVGVWGFGQGLTISNLGFSARLQGGSGGAELVDGSTDTGIRFEGGTSGWIDISLTGPYLLEKAHLALQGGEDMVVRWQFLVNGVFKDFFSRQSGEDWDLSYEGLVTDKIRLCVEGADLSKVLLKELSLQGRDVGTVWSRIQPVVVEGTPDSSSFYPVTNLFDSDTCTSWKTRPTSDDYWDDDSARRFFHEKMDGHWGVRDDWGSVAWADLGEGKHLHRIDVYFDEEAKATVVVQGLIEGSWQELGRLAPLPGRWVSLDSPKKQALVSQMKFTLTRGPSDWGSIGEVALWGVGAYAGDSYAQSLSEGTLTDGGRFCVFSFAAGDQRKASYEFALKGNGGPTPSLTVNGSPRSVRLIASGNGMDYFRADGLEAALNEGDNFVVVGGVGSRWVDGRVRLLALDGRMEVDWGVPSLSDGWQTEGWTGDSFVKRFSPEVSFGRLRLIGDGQLLLPDGSGGWIEGDYASEEGGKLYSSWGVLSQVKVVAGPGGIAEIQSWADQNSLGVPSVQLLWPRNGERLSWGDNRDGYLIGQVDRDGLEVKVNGHTATVRGDIFTIPLRQLDLDSYSLQTIEVRASQSSNLIASRSVSVLVGKDPEDITSFWFKTDKEIITESDSYTLSGLVTDSHLRILAGAQEARVISGAFHYVVSLQYGINTVLVYAYDVRTGAVIQKATATIIRYGAGIILTIDGEGQVAYVTNPKFVVSGTVVSRSHVKVTVNGKTVSISGIRYTGPAITLADGMNTITVIADDRVKPVTKTLKVFLDRSKPTLSLVQPTANAFYSHAVPVKGTVESPDPYAVVVNGVSYDASSGSFNLSIPMTVEGAFTFTLQPVNRAGTTGAVMSVPLKIDNTPPAAFVISANISGWSGNNQPTLSFATMDSYSGMDHYEVQVDSGSWTLQSSPCKLPPMLDGIHQVRVKALDVAGNSTIESVELKIDTAAPVAVGGLKAIPGQGSMEVAWKTVDTDIVRYHVIRAPAWPDGERTLSGQRLDDAAVSDGEVYAYQVWAEDKAGNMGPRVQSLDAIVGLTVQAVSSNPQEATVVDYEGMEVVIPSGALPQKDKVVLVQQIESQQLQDASAYPIVGPIYSISTLSQEADGTLNETSHAELSKEVVIILDYNESQVPVGFPEANLGVYYFDTTWNKWFLVEKSAVDSEHNKIVFLTNHFTSFSVQPTMIQDLSPQQLKDVGHNPFKGESSTGAVTVSPQGGTAMVEATEFVLQGKNGFTLPIKRMYDTGTAMIDSPSLSLSASISLGFNFSDIDKLIQMASFVDQLASNGTASLVGAIKGKVDGFLKHNGDYALSTGVGWRLSLPYVVTTNSTVMVRLPSGGYYGINQMESQNSFWSNPVSRTLDFDSHEGDDFHFRATQVRDNVDYTSIGVAATKISSVLKSSNVTGAVQLFASLIPGWNTIASELWTKDGTYYLFDGKGRVVQVKDKTGLSTFSFHYSGLLLADITDDLGRQVQFQYSSSSTAAIFLKPVITRISTSGFQGQDRTVSYHYNWTASADLAFLFNFLPTLDSAVDPVGRVSSYSYDRKALVAGGGSVKINFLALLLSIIPGAGFINSLLGLDTLTLSGHIEFNFPYTVSTVVAPGIGTTVVSVGTEDLSLFKAEGDDWFFGLFPTALKLSYDIILRLATESVRVVSSTGVTQTTSYSYEWDSQEYQFYVSKATTDNGRQRTIQYFSTVVHSRARFISWDDYVTSVLQSVFQSQGLTVAEVSTLQSGSSTYEVSSGRLLETTSNTWDTTHHRITASTTTRGPTSVLWTTFQYDTWGNQTYVMENSLSNNRLMKSERWMWYLNSGSSAPSAWTLPSLGADEPLSNEFTRDLLKGMLIHAYRPTISGGGFDERAEQYVYNSFGLRKSEGLWTGDHWARTDYEYFTDPTLLSAGAPRIKTGPNPGQTTTWDYDYSRPAKDFFIKAQTVQEVTDPAGNRSNITVETATDWSSGWKLYEKDGRGYITEYGYDKLGRLTDTTKPGDEPPLNPGAWNVVHLNSAWSRVAYNDTALTATVYKSSYSSGGANSGGNVLEVYAYDTLGQLTRVDKYNHIGLQNGTIVPLSPPEDSVTTLTYTAWGDVASMKDPNGHTTGFAYDSKGRQASISYPDGVGISTVYDDWQNLKTTTDERGVVAQEWSTWKGNVQTRIVDPSGINATTQTYYNGLEEPVAGVDALGQTTVTWFSPFGKPREVDHPSVDVWQSPSIPSPVLPTTSLTSITPQDLTFFDDAGQVIRQQNGYAGAFRSIDLNYDNAGRVTKKTVGTREEWSWYDASGNLVKHADPLAVESIKRGSIDASGTDGFSVKTYSNRNQLTSETDPTGATVRYRYDIRDRKIQMKDPRSNADPAISDSFTMNYLYDDLDRLVGADLPPITGQPRGMVQFHYDLRGNAIKQIDQAGRTTGWSYDARNRKIVQNVSGADGIGSLITAWGYDSKGNPVKEIVVDRLNAASPAESTGLVTSKTYDKLNRLTDTYLPDRTEKHLLLDKMGRPTSTSDARGYATAVVFNSLNKPISSTDPYNNATRTDYNVWGEPVAIIFDNSRTGPQAWVQGYDQYGELVYEQNNLGQVWTYVYNGRGLLTESTDPGRTTASSFYDDAGRIVSRSYLNGSSGLSESWTYDAAGSLVSASDGSVQTLINQAGGFYVPDPYDLIDSYRTTVGAKELGVSYTYDNALNPTTISYPDRSVVAYRYNGLGQLTDVPGFASGGRYNFMGRLTDLSASNGSKRTKTWDPATGILVGYDWHLTGKTARTLVWDNEGNLVGFAKDGYSSSYGYDKLSRLVATQEAGEFEVNTKDLSALEYGSRERDVAGRNPLEFSDPLLRVRLDYHASSVILNFQSARNINKIRILAVSRRINPRTLELYTSNDGATDNWTKLTDTTWQRDESGLTLQLASPHQAQFVKIHVTWDERDESNHALDRSTIEDIPSNLIQVWFTVNGHATTWTYDALGNRLTENDVKGSYAANKEYSYYAGSSRIRQASSWAFNYDANGNLTSRGNHGTWDVSASRFVWDPSEGELWQYTYDLKNRLVEVTRSAAGTMGLKNVALYTYDIRDLRVQATKGSIATYYQYDQSGDLLWTEDRNGQTKYVEVLGQIWAEVRTTTGTSTTYWHHTDHAGTTNVITDSSMQIVWDAEYDAFGAIAKSNGTIRSNGLYTGREMDPDIGLYYYNARWYDPTLGRFITEDPARDGINWFAYVNNNPLVYIDPTGLFSEEHQKALEGMEAAGGSSSNIESARKSFAKLEAALSAPAGKDTQQAIQTWAKTTNEYGSPEAKQSATADEIRDDLAYWVAVQLSNGHTPTVEEMMLYAIKDLQDRKKAEGWLQIATGIEVIAVGRILGTLEAPTPTGSTGRGFSTGQDEAVFWSGVRGGQETAARWVAEHGGTTLETTMAARGIRLPPFDSGNPAVVSAWREAAKDFAAGARGNVRVLQADAVRVKSIWAKDEFPALKTNPNVTSVTMIDPRTGLETLLWAR